MCNAAKNTETRKRQFRGLCVKVNLLFCFGSYRRYPVVYIQCFIPPLPLCSVYSPDSIESLPVLHVPVLLVGIAPLNDSLCVYFDRWLLDSQFDFLATRPEYIPVNPMFDLKFVACSVENIIGWEVIFARRPVTMVETSSGTCTSTIRPAKDMKSLSHQHHSQALLEPTN